MGMRIFARITKVDEAKHEVWGRATQEIIDNSDECFDYSSSKPYFKNWSSEFEKSTDGKSLGNIRAMHGSVAAGKVISLDLNDAEKAIDIGTKIVDAQEWDKVLEGVYTGFSIGGKYVRKWKDGMATRYTAKPNEISLVDKPCVPTAKFYEVIKMDGSTQQAEFKSQESAIDTLAKLLNDGEVTPQQLVDLVKGVVKEDLAKLEKPDDVSQDDWDAMSDEEKQACVDEEDDVENADGAADGDAMAGKKPEADKSPDGAADGDKMKGKEPEADKSPNGAADGDAKKDDDAAMADTKGDMKKYEEMTPVEQNAAVEVEARKLSTEAFVKLEPAAQAGRKPDADWGNFVPDAIRNVKKGVPAELKQPEKVADGGGALSDGSFPIKKAADLDGAVKAYDRAKDKEVAKAHIIARAKALSATDKLPTDWEESTQSATANKADKTDDPELTLSKVLGDAITIMAAELDVAKRLEDPACGGDELKVVITKALGDTDLFKAGHDLVALRVQALEKYGARHSKDDAGRLQSIHDHSVGMGAKCDKADMATDKNSPAEPMKSDSGTLLKLATQDKEIATLKKNIGDLASASMELAKELKRVKDTPLPIKGRLRTVAKDGDVIDTTDDVKKKDDDKLAAPGTHDPETAMKLLKGEISRVGIRKA